MSQYKLTQIPKISINRIDVAFDVLQSALKNVDCAVTHGVCVCVWLMDTTKVIVIE